VEGRPPGKGDLSIREESGTVTAASLRGIYFEKKKGHE